MADFTPISQSSKFPPSNHHEASHEPEKNFSDEQVESLRLVIRKQNPSQSVETNVPNGIAKDATDVDQPLEHEASSKSQPALANGHHSPEP